MGKIYKRKRRSCHTCKPHKMGWADKKKYKDRKTQVLDEKEMKEAKQGDQS